ncbi:hypothetical protein AB0C51_15810 [Streptomyces pathocidini]|uniref:hypothetical protein n=1 Tax=Streptomyces pathocidini TaxID=1650571 RepID=UPI0033C8F7BF
MANTTIIVVMAIWLTGLAGWAVRDWVKRRRTQLVFIICSAAVTVYGEAHWDVLIGVQQSTSADALIVYSSFGRDITLWVLLAYMAWVGTMGYLAFAAIERRWSAGRLWKLYAGMLAFDLVAEILIVRGGVYSYYGNQPFRIFGIPFAWPIVYTTTFMILGFVTHQFFAHFPGIWRLLYLPVVPSTALGVVTFAGWPVTSGLGMGLSVPAMTALGMGSTSIAVFLFGLMARRQAAGATGTSTPAATTPVPSGRVRTERGRSRGGPGDQ